MINDAQVAFERLPVLYVPVGSLVSLTSDFSSILRTADPGKTIQNDRRAFLLAISRLALLYILRKYVKSRMAADKKSLRT